MFVINPGRHVGLRGSQQGPVHTLVILSRRSLCPTPTLGTQNIGMAQGQVAGLKPQRDNLLDGEKKHHIMIYHEYSYYVAYVLKHFALVCCCPYFAGSFRRGTVPDEKLCRTFNTWRSQAMEETALKTRTVNCEWYSMPIFAGQLSRHQEDAFGSSFVEAGCFAGNVGDVHTSQHFWLLLIGFDW